MKKILVSVMLVSTFLCTQAKADTLSDQVNLMDAAKNMALLEGQKYPTSYASDVVDRLDKLIGIKLNQNFTCMDIAIQYTKGAEGYRDTLKASPVKYNAMEKVIESGSNYIISRCNDIVE